MRQIINRKNERNLEINSSKTELDYFKRKAFNEKKFKESLEKQTETEHQRIMREIREEREISIKISLVLDSKSLVLEVINMESNKQRIERILTIWQHDQNESGHDVDWSKIDTEYEDEDVAAYELINHTDQYSSIYILRGDQVISIDGDEIIMRSIERFSRSILE